MSDFKNNLLADHLKNAGRKEHFKYSLAVELIVARKNYSANHFATSAAA
jgi:hypothetical protein